MSEPGQPGEPAPARPQDVPYATPSTDKLDGTLVPLVSGFALLVLGLATLVFGRGDGDYSGRNSEGIFLIDATVVVTALALVVVGLIVIFRSLRRYA